MLSRTQWYVFVFLKWAVTLSIGGLAWWFIHSSGLPLWARILADVLIAGILIGVVVMGPDSYGGYQKLAYRFKQVKTRGARGEAAGPSRDSSVN